MWGGKFRKHVGRLKFQPFPLALQTGIIQSNPFIPVPTLNLIKPLDTHVQLLFLV